MSTRTRYPTKFPDCLSVSANYTLRAVSSVKSGHQNTCRSRTKKICDPIKYSLRSCFKDRTTLKCSIICSLLCVTVSLLLLTLSTIIQVRHETLNMTRLIIDDYYQTIPTVLLIGLPGGFLAGMLICGHKKYLTTHTYNYKPSPERLQVIKHLQNYPTLKTIINKMMRTEDDNEYHILKNFYYDETNRLKKITVVANLTGTDEVDIQQETENILKEINTALKKQHTHDLLIKLTTPTQTSRNLQNNTVRHDIDVYGDINGSE